MITILTEHGRWLVQLGEWKVRFFLLLNIQPGGKFRNFSFNERIIGYLVWVTDCMAEETCVKAMLVHLYCICKSMYSSSPHWRSAPSCAASGWTDLSSSDHLSSFVSGRESCLVRSLKLGLPDVLGCLYKKLKSKSWWFLDWVYHELHTSMTSWCCKWHEDTQVEEGDDTLCLPT